MAATRLIALHIGKGKTAAKALQDTQMLGLKKTGSYWLVNKGFSKPFG